MTQPKAVAAPRVNRWDNLRFNALQTIPQLVRGMFASRPRWSSVLERRHPDPQGVRLITELRDRYDSDYLWLSVGGKPTLLVLDPAGIRRILDSSPDVYGPPDVKVRGMSHFQPGAVTISTGDAWRRRRDFHDEILAAGEPIHPSAAELLGVVERAVEPLVSRARPSVTWSQLQSTFRRLAGWVVFGDSVSSESLLQQLDHLLERANRLGRRTETPELRTFQAELRTRLCARGVSGLAPAACRHIEPGDPLPVAGQVPHWLFALKGSLAANCVSALSLVAAHPGVQDRARDEVASVDLCDPESVNGLVYLEGCLRDAMRLWPTTPLLVRKALRSDDLEGHPVDAGAQVMIHNGFNHRNPSALADPDSYQPESWQRGVWDYRFNSMSNGPQACAGRELALLLGKAMLARMLQPHRWRLAEPELDPERPIPYGFDRTSVVLEGNAAQQLRL